MVFDPEFGKFWPLAYFSCFDSLVCNALLSSDVYVCR